MFKNKKGISQFRKKKKEKKKKDFTRDFQHARKNGPSNCESGVMTEKNQR